MHRKILIKLELWCIVNLAISCMQLLRAVTQYKYNLFQPAFDHIKLAYFKVALSIYGVPSLRVSAVVIILKLYLSGDVERNPGPEGKFVVCMCKVVSVCLFLL